MKFAEPLMLLYGACALIIAALCFILTEKRKSRLRKKLLGPAADDPRFVSLSKSKRVFRLILILLALILITLASARPYIRYQEMASGDLSRDVMVIFDVSKSMRAADLPPSRMEQAKYLLRQVIKAFPEDRFGLIPFAGEAFVSCPLTRDHHTLQQCIDQLDYDSVPVGGTNLEQALLAADKSFAASAGEQRVILLLTDGDELTGNTAKALKQLEEQHIPLIAVGFGSPDAAAPVPDEEGKIMRDSSGEAVGSKLNEALLNRIALATGGRYFRSTVGDTGFSAVKTAITDLASPRFSESEKRAVPDDLFGYFVIAALIVLALAAGISSRKKVKVVLFVLLPLMLTAAEDNGKNVPASDPAALYQQALEMQKNGSGDAAAIYEKLAASADAPELIRSRAMQNLAVIRHRSAREIVEKSRQQLQAQQLDEAIKTLTGSQGLFSLSKELYAGSLNTADQSADSGRISNYNHLLRDDLAAKELLKKLQELKAQQQKTREQTQQAQQQNQQQPQGDKEQQNQQQSDKAQQQAQQPQGDKEQQNQQQSDKAQQQAQQSQGDKEQQNQQPQDGSGKEQEQRNQASQQSKAAADSAEKLSQQAKELGQDKLADQAQSAADDLKEAEKLQQQGFYRDAAEKLEQAKEKLGKPEDKSDGKSGENKDAQNAGSGNSGEEKAPGAGEVQEDNSEKEAQNAAGKKLELLDDEAGQLRDAIRRQQQLRRRRVNKDW